ncbi:MAG: hypothetical protein B7C24_09295 [Bacteroidetes bacterium 4572_77]|nr:MAG: hypothetical protein B7C24_09295 [Bacteroidetes bacterium 4572_77]
MKKAAAIILASGFSSRMGKEKIFLPFVNNRNFLNQLISVYQESQVQQILIVLRKELYMLVKAEIKVMDKVVLLVNPTPERDRAFSIQLGIKALSDFDYLFIQNVDNPFTSIELINAMLRAGSLLESVVPVYAHKKAHPVLLSNKLIKEIPLNSNNSFNLKQIIRDSKPLLLNWHKKNILANVNTQEEYDRWF